MNRETRRSKPVKNYWSNIQKELAKEGISLTDVASEFQQWKTLNDTLKKQKEQANEPKQLPGQENQA